jgi:hypothetical protein
MQYCLYMEVFCTYRVMSGGYPEDEQVMLETCRGP